MPKKDEEHRKRVVVEEIKEPLETEELPTEKVKEETPLGSKASEAKEPAKSPRKKLKKS